MNESYNRLLAIEAMLPNLPRGVRLAEIHKLVSKSLKVSRYEVMIAVSNLKGKGGIDYSPETGLR